MTKWLYICKFYKKGNQLHIHCFHGQREGRANKVANRGFVSDKGIYLVFLSDMQTKVRHNFIQIIFEKHISVISFLFCVVLFYRFTHHRFPG